MLFEAGIEDEASLRELGAVAAYRRVAKAGLNPSLNLLYALEGALSDRHWNRVRREQKADLLRQIDALEDLEGRPC